MKGIVATTIVLLIAANSVSGQVINGDFEAGATGFITDYAIGSPGNVPDGTIAALSDGETINLTRNKAFPDHTSGAGLALYVNGSTVADQAVWQQTVPVQSNTQYTFNFFYTNWAFGQFDNDATLTVQVDGVQVGPAGATRSAGIGSWEPFTVTFNSLDRSTVDVAIVETSLAYSGNDFAIDDITLVPEPSSVTLLCLTSVFMFRRQHRMAVHVQY